MCTFVAYLEEEIHGPLASTVGVALRAQALLSASSMKSAIARNCLELAQSNHPPCPVRMRAYINR